MAMLRNKSLVIGAAFAFLLTMGLLCTDPVLAQDSDEVKDEAGIEEIRVEAPAVNRKVTARGPNGYTTEVIQLHRQVIYADLDLTKGSDIEELEKRLEMSAKEACEALKQLFPKGQKNAGDVYRCTRHAIEHSEKEFDSVVATAN
jgi:UrcA family protein